MAYKFDVDTDPNPVIYPAVTYPNDSVPVQTYSDIRCLVGGDSVFTGTVKFKGPVSDRHNIPVDMLRFANWSYYSCKDNTNVENLIGGSALQVNLGNGSSFYVSNVPNSLPQDLLDQYQVFVYTTPSQAGEIQQNEGGPMQVNVSLNVDVRENAVAGNKLMFYLEQDGFGTPLEGKAETTIGVVPPAGSEYHNLSFQSYGITFGGGNIVRLYVIALDACKITVENVQFNCAMKYTL